MIFCEFIQKSHIPIAIPMIFLTPRLFFSDMLLLFSCCCYHRKQLLAAEQKSRNRSEAMKWNALRGTARSPGFLGQAAKRTHSSPLKTKKSPSSYLNELACTRTRFNSHLFSPRCTHPLLPVVTSDSPTLPAPISCCWGKVFVRAGTHSHTLARKTTRWKALTPPLAERSPEPGTPGSAQHAAPQPSEQKAKASERRCPLIPCALCQLWKQKLLKLKAARVREHMHAEHPSWNQRTLSPPFSWNISEYSRRFYQAKHKPVPSIAPLLICYCSFCW